MKLNAIPLVLQSILSGSLPSWDALSLRLPSASNAHPVCIVGAGPSGLTIAHELEAKQYSTVIFDSQPVVGGKCQAYYNNGPNGSVAASGLLIYSTLTFHFSTTFHPLGALLFTNETYHNTLPIIEESGVKLYPGISPSVWTRYLYGVGDEAGDVVKQDNPDMGQYLLILMEVIRYTTYWDTEFKPKYTAMRYVVSLRRLACYKKKS
jgi:monoamine oxidase